MLVYNTYILISSHLCYNNSQSNLVDFYTQLKKMKKLKINNSARDKESMLTHKTNEDFNKKQPVPSDFKEDKGSVNKNDSSKKLRRNKPKK